MHIRNTALAAISFAFALTAAIAAPQEKIDRHALVAGHNPHLTKIDPHAPMMIGNGEIGFTADITGLQTFPDRYAKLAPLLTEAQWAWHSFPNPHHYTAKDTMVPVAVRGRTQYYPYMRTWDAAKTNPAFEWIRENPHRFSLGRMAFELSDRDGKPARFEDLRETRQTLDMWRGVLISHFVYDGMPVDVQTFVLPEPDAIYTIVTSPLIAEGRLRVLVKFPGVSPALNPDPSDWTHTDKHVTRETARAPGRVTLARRIDDTRYFVEISADETARIDAVAPHAYRVQAAPGARRLTVASGYGRTAPKTALPDAATAQHRTEAHWRQYWTTGGAIDFSGSTDPRAKELERRVVLSQYLMAVNGAGEVPPQEEGLFSNSWNGKFHLEMHPWHAAHFALWGHPERLARSMNWYIAHLPDAETRAKAHGVRGAWWPKMVGPDGIDSPSMVSPFLMWQQPHPIFMAELLYRAEPTPATLRRYGKLVAETADLLASYPHRDAKTGRLRLGPPLIPAQENWDPMTTFDPAFELAYFRFGIETAQKWRVRNGQKRRADWDKVLKDLAPLPEADGLILPTGSNAHFWTDAASDDCRRHALKPQCQNRDHPSFLMALGWLPGDGVDRNAMARTFDVTLKDWDLRQTWGWDYPMMAMTAARLHRPEQAVEMLFYPGKNNQYGVTGMTPRVHIAEHAASFVPGAPGTQEKSPDGPGYRRAAETYFPSNGGLLAAVALMAAGWDGETYDTLGHAPGFPKGWTVRVENVLPMP